MNVWIKGVEYEVTTDPGSGRDVYTPVATTSPSLGAVRYIEGILYARVEHDASGEFVWMPANDNNYLIPDSSALSNGSDTECCGASTHLLGSGSGTFDKVATSSVKILQCGVIS